MIKHEIIVRAKQGLRHEALERGLREICGLLLEIPGVERVRYGVNKAPAYRHFMIVADLTDQEALEGMGRHPQHARAMRMLARMAESTAVGSYLVGSERRG
jgi:hypothetical protein